MTLWVAITTAILATIAAISGWWTAVQRGKRLATYRQSMMASAVARDRAVAASRVAEKTANAAIDQREKLKKLNKEITDHVANYPDAAAGINAAIKASQR